MFRGRKRRADSIRPYTWYGAGVGADRIRPESYILYMYVYIILYIACEKIRPESVARKGLPPLYLEKNEDVRALNGV